jgi:hypothetical protein
VKQETSADGSSQGATAVDALQAAREMPRGMKRSDALLFATLLVVAIIMVALY